MSFFHAGRRTHGMRRKIEMMLSFGRIKRWNTWRRIKNPTHKHLLSYVDKESTKAEAEDNHGRVAGVVLID